MPTEYKVDRDLALSEFCHWKDSGHNPLRFVELIKTEPNGYQIGIADPPSGTTWLLEYDPAPNQEQALARLGRALDEIESGQWAENLKQKHQEITP
ncbi:hypothetical protein SAMN05660443_0214 [Marinospirillum celere]|uniref:Uncharacterized protein n=1 Tax=Marinospirillum celere TaxID=1122252 RepID=A0A1I1DZB8_9GAMM|nr:hypothetical protein [Marinospirillum celere]SFB80147.1 hypothetical protein SAMN05660443_0214 [Marinospirillum celere]